MPKKSSKTEKPVHDYSGTHVEPSKNILQEIEAMANLQLDLQVGVQTAEAALAKAKEELRAVQEDRFPNLMREAGQQKLTTESGIIVEVSDKKRASIIKGEAEEAYKWLEENNFGKVIKREMKLTLAKGDKETASRFEKALADAGLKLPIQKKLSVHSATLSSLVTEEMEKGTKFPSCISVYDQKNVKLKIKS